MPSISKNALMAVAGLVAAAQAFTQPVGDPTWGALLTPDKSSQVVRGQQFDITWDPRGEPTQGKTVSLVLCKGPGANCQIQPNAIAEGLPANQKSFQWNVPCALTPGVASTATGYGMLIIVDGTGEYQFSTQFSVQAGSSCGSSGAVSSPTASSGDSSESQTASPSPAPASSANSAETTSVTPTAVTSTATSVATTEATSNGSSSQTVTSAARTTLATSASSVNVAGVTTRPAGATSSPSPTNAAPRATGLGAGAMVAVGMAFFAL